MQTKPTEEADLLETLSFIVPLPAPLQYRVNQEAITETFNRKHLLLRPGETARRLYFIRSGFLRAFFIDENGKACTTWFMGKGDLMISVYSFFTQQPAHEYIEVLQDCKLQSISWQQLNAYYADFAQGNLLGRIVMQKYYIMSEERAIFLRTQIPKLRYEKLLEYHPDIEQQTSQINIASYLGISRETLSRIKREKLQRYRQAQNSKNLNPVYNI
ncbi:cAMP-binding domain of CRP or a regulatory subunit of cAMP-dependent protein kinases [Pedobacter suwonensis]|uniref:cAMP-binding domain of CRP or a regulatory subunit of cAMP-dependent protein kinases n=1 Tax=Pedobacter suwonensis TaxID=332999 RepID=A0A1I0SNY4_9SPHI|nr:Crp/Fnr family transcriptional regulator [Pedobacter suwonensis]SFA41244.1 cAMP-binding domain of CRP or a regulatory subunit of cAMP-dependent protein kinases [Pedobacter suwonensis]